MSRLLPVLFLVLMLLLLAISIYVREASHPGRSAVRRCIDTVANSATADDDGDALTAQLADCEPVHGEPYSRD